MELAKKDGGKELRAWVYRISIGDVEAAYQSIVKDMSGIQLGGELDKINAEWRQHANDQAEKMELRNAAVMAMVKVLLPIALAALGF